MKLNTAVFTLINIIFLFPLVTFAADGAREFVPLVGVPETETGGSFESFINSLYYLSIGIAALLAVIKIIIAGVKYMLSEIVTDKGTAKKEIKGALLGLLIVLSAVMILEFINPQLTNINYQPETVTSPEYTQTMDTNKQEVTKVVREGGELIKSINEKSHTLIPLTPLPRLDIPKGKENEWICKNVVPENCPYENGTFQFGREAEGESRAFCYKGDWNSESDGCVVQAANRTLHPTNAKKTFNNNYDNVESYLEEYNQGGSDEINKSLEEQRESVIGEIEDSMEETEQPTTTITQPESDRSYDEDDFWDADRKYN